MVSYLEIDKILPQTQCRQCGYQGCLEYARAIADGEEINRCPPGGDKGILELAQLLGREVLTLNESCREHVPFEYAHINPRLCIGCKLCIKACPTDAIIGTTKHMHVVDVELCNGCCLCQIACPMDCIEMIPESREWTETDKNLSRQRFQEKNQRIRLKIELAEKKLEEKSGTSVKKNFLANLMKKSNHEPS